MYISVNTVPNGGKLFVSADGALAPRLRPSCADAEGEADSVARLTSGTFIWKARGPEASDGQPSPNLTPPLSPLPLVSGSTALLSVWLGWRLPGIQYGLWPSFSVECSISVAKLLEVVWQLPSLSPDLRSGKEKDRAVH
eukprot:3085299-Pyramimonas_sp.AAC.1